MIKRIISLDHFKIIKDLEKETLCQLKKDRKQTLILSLMLVKRWHLINENK